MNITRLYEILDETTAEFRKGGVFEGDPELVAQAEAGAEQLQGGGVLHIYAMPHETDAPAGLEMVDVEFEQIGVDKGKAEQRRADLIGLLNQYPDPAELAGGPSYITVGARIGGQSGAFRLFALGKVLGIWDVITPAMWGATGAEARTLAGNGFVMITGYRPA